MSPFVIYLIIKLNALQGLFTGFAIVSGIATIMAAFISGVDYTESRKDEAVFWNKIGKRTIKAAIPVCIVCTILEAITPSTKEAAAIYLIPKVVNNESVQNISANTLHLLEEYTAELLTEMKKETSKKIKQKVDYKEEQQSSQENSSGN